MQRWVCFFALAFGIVPFEVLREALRTLLGDASQRFLQFVMLCFH